MDKDFEKKVKKKKTKRIVIAVLAVIVVALTVMQLQFNTVTNVVDAAKEKITGKETVKVTLEIKCSPKTTELSDKKDGVILKETEYKMEKGSSAFDLLKKATTEKDIKMESSYTKAYDTYFIEGIDGVYAGDAGGMSGWLYYINKEFPQYGASEYELKKGDEILFVYSKDGGQDVDLSK